MNHTLNLPNFNNIDNNISCKKEEGEEVDIEILEDVTLEKVKDNGEIDLLILLLNIIREIRLDTGQSQEVILEKM